MTHHPSYGADLQWDPAGGTAYGAIGQVKDISGPNISRGDIDVTDHDNRDDQFYRIFLPGVPDPGDLTFDIGFDDANTAHGQGVGTGLLGDVEGDGCTLAAWQLTLNSCTGTAIWTFDGYVNSFGMTNPVEGEITASVGVKISGKPTLTIT